VADDPLLADLTGVRIPCTAGVIRLKGRVPQINDTARVEANIRGAVARAGLPYAGLRNALQASVLEARPMHSARAGTLAPLLDAP
jgi:hypothetical protein